MCTPSDFTNELQFSHDIKERGKLQQVHCKTRGALSELLTLLFARHVLRRLSSIRDLGLIYNLGIHHPKRLLKV